MRKHEELVRLLLARSVLDEEYGANKKNLSALALAALAQRADAVHTLKRDPVTGQAPHEMQTALERFAVETPLEGSFGFQPRRDLVVQHASTREGDPITISDDQLRAVSQEGAKFALVVEEFERNINDQLKLVQTSDGRFPSITFNILERNMTFLEGVGDVDSGVGLQLHKDRYTLLDPDSGEDNEFIGIVIVPMLKSSGTMYDSASQTIVPPDGDIVFFNPKEIHSVPADINTTYDGANVQELVSRRSVVIGIVQGSDAHDMGQMANAIAMGFGPEYNADFLEGTTHVSEIQAADAASRLAMNRNESKEPTRAKKLARNPMYTISKTMRSLSPDLLLPIVYYVFCCLVRAQVKEARAKVEGARVKIIQAQNEVGVAEAAVMGAEAVVEEAKIRLQQAITLQRTYEKRLMLCSTPAAPLPPLQSPPMD